MTLKQYMSGLMAKFVAYEFRRIKRSGKICGGHSVLSIFATMAVVLGINGYVANNHSSNVQPSKEIHKNLEDSLKTARDSTYYGLMGINDSTLIRNYVSIRDNTLTKDYVSIKNYISIPFKR